MRKDLLYSGGVTRSRQFLRNGIAAGCALALYAGFAGQVHQVHAAASLYVSPPAGTFTVGSTFTVSVYVNTAQDFINAVELNLTFPPDKLQVTSPTGGKSLIQIWTAQPSFSNTEGTIRFQGIIPNPGIKTDAGLISTITFRVKDVGNAPVLIRDSSRVLLNDGEGTNILGSVAGGIYRLALPPPAGPAVASPTHPDQEAWSKFNSVSFRWEGGPDVEGYSYVFDSDPAADPDNISEGTSTRVTYGAVADGLRYFHIKSFRAGSWGGVTTYKVNVDSTPPATFEINFSPGARTSSKLPIIDWTTTDAVSGVNHYELKFIPLDVPTQSERQSSNITPFFIEAVPPYFTQLEYGKYNVVVRAYDRAENYYQSERRLAIVKPFFDGIYGDGLRIGEGFVLGWPYVWGILGGLVALLLYLGWLVWRLHRKVHAHLEAGVAGHPEVAPQLETLQVQQEEFESGKILSVLLAILLFAGMWLGVHKPVSAQEFVEPRQLALAPPLVTLFPSSISNDEILYIGGHTAVPQTDVVIYIQHVESGGVESVTTRADKNGEWFYTFPQFLNTGHYILWTQLKQGEQLSAPSSRLDLNVVPTALQFGKTRVSFERLYFILLVLVLLVIAGLAAFAVYHGYHFRRKNAVLKRAIQEAREAIRHGFAVLHQDIETELELIRRERNGRELSAEERRREAKLHEDLKAIRTLVGKEMRGVEKAERKLS